MLENFFSNLNYSTNRFIEKENIKNTILFTGILTEEKIREKQIEINKLTLLEDKDIILHFNSPGGSVIGVPALAERIFNLRNKKNITGYVNGMCCSACYFIASACSKIIASPESVLGSVGVYAEYVDDSKFYEKMGFIKKIFRSKQSPYKNADIFTKEGEEQIQNILDKTAAHFLKSVARYRNLDLEKVKSEFGEGKVLVAEDALKVKMIDEIGFINNKEVNVMTKEQEEKIFLKLNNFEEVIKNLSLKIENLENDNSILKDLKDNLYKERVEQNAFNAKLIKLLEKPSSEDINNVKSFF